MPAQDFKGTVNGNTITEGSGTITMSPGKTLTLTENVTLSETPPLNANVLKGDGTAGRVLRAIQITVDNGTDASTLKCTVTSLWNGDTVAETNNIGKGATTGVFSLSANGKDLRLLNTGITGDLVAVLSADIFYNVSGTALLSNASSNGGLFINMRDITTSAVQDLTVLVDTGGIAVKVFYVTSA